MFRFISDADNFDVLFPSFRPLFVCSGRRTVRTYRKEEDHLRGLAPLHIPPTCANFDKFYKAIRIDVFRRRFGSQGDVRLGPTERKK